MKTLVAQRAQVKVCDNHVEMATEASKEVIRITNGAISSRGKCAIALSGGTTPQLLYDKLGSKAFSGQVNWGAVHFFVSDERCVPLNDKDSNFGNAQREFLSKIGVPAENLHPVKNPDKAPAKAALAYEKEIKEFFQLTDGEFPKFDLILLGMGPDGHCASLFPNTKALEEKQRICVENLVEKLQVTRITFSIPTINHARNVMFMVQGPEKSKVLKEVLVGDTVLYPVQHIMPEAGNLQWLLDKKAASDFLKSGAGSR